MENNSYGIMNTYTDLGGYGVPDPWAMPTTSTNLGYGEPQQGFGIVPRTSAPSSVFNEYANYMGGIIGDALEKYFGSDKESTNWLNNGALDWAKFGLGAYTGITGIQLAKDNLALAKQQWDVQKDYMARNYANQVKTYNSAMQDLYKNRAFIEGKNQDWANQQYEQNKLS